MPDVEVPRSDVVAARIARKEAPLFGVAGQQSPFDFTWVCDFGSMTLAEIARGAPFPLRNVQSAMDEETAPVNRGRGRSARPGPESARPGLRERTSRPPWQAVDRAVWMFQRAPNPAAIAHATRTVTVRSTRRLVSCSMGLTGGRRTQRAVASVRQYMAGNGIGVEVRLAVLGRINSRRFLGSPRWRRAAIQARAIERGRLTTPGGSASTAAGAGLIGAPRVLRENRGAGISPPGCP